MTTQNPNSKQYLFISDFDQTLSFNDSGLVLGDILGIPDLRERIAGLSDIHLVQQGGELAYLLLHDPDLRRVRKEHLIEAGKRVRLKKDIALLSASLKDLSGHQFEFYVVSAAPEEVIQSALEGIVDPHHIYATKFRYDTSGEIQSIVRVGAGYGKVVVVEELRTNLMISHDRIVYVGDGSSDIHVMLHLNRMDGLTIAVSENKYITQIARRTVLGEDALSVLVPVLEEVLGWDSTRIRFFFEANGLVLREWTKTRTDTITLSVDHSENAASSVKHASDPQ
jgi:2-hydroxy-3-keto-5-methylthiopentenyl-1-phosphate phosphatase